MTDFTRGVGNGTMMIRDTGGWVEFWFLTGSSTWINGQHWHALFDGGWHDYTINIPRGGSWTKFGAVYISSRQNVTFRIDASGLGWATSDLTAWIERARQPDPPGAPYFGERTTSQIHTAFDYGYDGGGAIDDAELWYSFDGQARYMVKGRDVWISGLSPKTKYYFWGKVHNFMGWSGLSARAEAWTVGVPDAPRAPSVTAVNVISASGSQSPTDPWDGGSPIREFQTGYGTDPNTPQSFISGKSINLSNLTAGAKYYFWARARNDLGWGPWSIRTDVQLPAGALLRTGGQYKRVLPWVKVDGVWRLTTPWVNSGGTWRKTT